PPCRSRIAFVAIVVPWATPSAPSSRIPLPTAWEGSDGDGTLAVTTSRPRNPTKFVKVPPTSTPASIVGRIVRDHKRLRAANATAPERIAAGGRAQDPLLPRVPARNCA